MYTSGSTGNPRAVRLTHRGIASSLSALCAACGLDARTRVLSTLPLNASHGLFVHGLATLVHGGTIVLAAPLTPYTALRFWEVACEAGAGFFSTVPAALSLLVSMAEGSPPSGLRVFSASSPLSDDLAGAFSERFGSPVANSFGMTEAAGWFLYGGPEAPRGAVGRPTRCQVRLDDPSRQEGEMWIRGPQVTTGYWNNPQADAEGFQDGWLRTGDRLRVDEAGWYYCVGRLRRVIQRAGRSVHPEDIEAVLAAFPGVAEAAVVGVRHDVYGEVPRAFVVARPGVTLDEKHLYGHLRKSLAAFRLPRWLEVVEQLPHLRTGKPDLEKLAARPVPE